MNKQSSVLNGPVVKRLGEILHDSDGLLSLIKLNFLFILTLMPVIPFVSLFTCGSSVTAILDCTNHLVKTGYVPELKKRYLSVFRSNIKKQAFPGFILLSLTGILSFDVYYYLINSTSNVLYIPVSSISLLGLITLWSLAIHFFTNGDKYDETILQKVKRAAITALSEMRNTLIAILFSIIFLLSIILLLPSSLPVLITIGFSVPALASAFAHTKPEW